MKSTVCNDQVIVPTRHRLTVDEYHRMGDAAIFGEDDRVELIDGELVDMAPIGSRHAYVVDVLTRVLVKHAAQSRLVRVQNPIQLGEFGEPEPDIAVVRNGNYFDHHPQANDVLLIIEVSDTSLDFDRTTKLPFYARYGISEVWIIDLNGKRVDVYRNPLREEQKYRDITRYSEGFVVAEGIPEVEIRVDNLWS